MKDSNSTIIEHTMENGDTLRRCSRCMMMLDEFGFPDSKWYTPAMYNQLLNIPAVKRCDHTKGKSMPTVAEFHVSNYDEARAVLFLQSQGYEVYKNHGGRAVVPGNLSASGRVNAPVATAGEEVRNSTSVTQVEVLKFVTGKQLSDVLSSFAGQIVDLIVHKTDISEIGNVFQVNGKFYAVREEATPADEKSKLARLLFLCNNPSELLSALEGNGKHFSASFRGWDSYNVHGTTVREAGLFSEAPLTVSPKLTSGTPIPSFKSLLSEETKNRLRRNSDHVIFDFGWLYNKNGEIGIAQNLPGVLEARKGRS